MVAVPAVHPHWTTVAELRAFFADDHVHMALLADQGRLIGTVERSDLAAAAGEETYALAVAELEGRTISADAALPEALDAMRRGRRRRLAVTSGDSALVGLLCLKADGSGFCSDEDVAARRQERRSGDQTTTSRRRE